MKRSQVAVAVAAILSAAGSGKGSMGHAATLPVPCSGAACGSAAFVGLGNATASQVGSKLTVNQTTPNTILNWKSFNISADGTVQFVQPSTSAVALNRTFQADPMQIFGALNANGHVYLINQNGILFGPHAQVNVGGLVASTLDLNAIATQNGTISLLAPGQYVPAGANAAQSQPAFQPFANGAPSGALVVESGAQIIAASGGQILMFAPAITNEGTITTPGGQTVLAAGNEVYLAENNPSDLSLRGIVVAVQGNGTVTNGTAADSSVTSPSQLVGQISAATGNVTLAALAVNQLGRISATTSVDENGSIYLVSGNRSGAGALQLDSSATYATTPTLPPDAGGTLTVGAHSDTEVTLDAADSSTSIWSASTEQIPSDVTMYGKTIELLNDSTVRATAGQIAIEASGSSSGAQPSTVSDGSQVYVAPGALLDVSGASVVLPVSFNVIPVKLEGVELADDPQQRNSFLHGSTVYVDIRQGTPLANVSGEIDAIQYDVAERNLAGGTISIEDEHGDVVLSPGTQLNLSGGEIQYTPGYLDTTELVTSAGQVVNIASAQPDLQYAGIVNSTTSGDTKWGVSQTYMAVPPIYSPGYIEGKDAGTLELISPRFVFDASVTANTVAGIYQTQPDSSSDWDPTTSEYRPYNQVPKGATLEIGSGSGLPDYSSDLDVANITVVPGEVLPGLTNADGSPFDPLTDPLPDTYTASTLRPDLFGPNAFDNVQLFTNGSFLEPAGQAINLTPGGAFDVTARSIDIQGSINAPGGTIDAIAQPTLISPETQLTVSLTLGSDASLMAEGAWVNENPLLYPEGNFAPLYISGGSISLKASNPDVDANNPPPAIGTRAIVDLSQGSVIDVSAGGEYTASGSLVAGTGGSIRIAAATPLDSEVGAPPLLYLGSALRGYALYDGGSLSLEASSVCIASANCSGSDPTVLWVSPAELSAGGFGSYALQADQGALTVEPGTDVTLQQQNFRLPANFAYLPNAASLSGVASVTLLPELLRDPVSLALTEAYAANASFVDSVGNVSLALSFNPSSPLPPVPSLVIGTGAAIDADPGASIAVSSDTLLIEDGTLRAPGGAISLNLGFAGEPPLEGFEPSQGIWLGANGVLDVSGTPQISVDAAGLRTGQVLSGGTVTLLAQQGSIELLPGSLIDVAGASGVIDTTPVGGGAARSEQVASAGGTLSLTAAEGIELGGTMEAAAGTPGPGLEQPEGGVLTVALDSNTEVTDEGSPQLSPTIVVSQSATPTVVAPGTAVPMGLIGQAAVSANTLASSGFGSVTLQAAPLGTTLPGIVDFQGDVTLSAPRELVLDAAVYTVSPGATAQIESPYVEFGSSDVSDLITVASAQGGAQFTPTVGTGSLAATSGTGRLDVSGGFIELYGYTALQGISTASFISSGDLQLQGVRSDVFLTPTTVSGGLFADGTVNLSADQIYPTTLTQFVISADPSVARSYTNPTSGSITVQGAEGPNSDLLSAGGVLTLSAATIVQDGVLRAPFGTIALDAESLTLGAGSLTSTSANGLTIPFGTTRGGFDWVYEWYAANGATDGIEVFGTGGTPPPAQNIALNGANVSVEKGADIDVAGGGDLQAYEFVAGTSGTNDVLSAAYAQANGGQNEFAIIPGLRINVAPYDPVESAGSTLQPGDAVYLAGGSGVPAGTYILLPARYALLPGAYLISPMGGASYQDMAPGQTFPANDGGTIVAGYYTVAGLNVGSSRTMGFDVTPASLVVAPSAPLAEAQYNLTSADSFFTAEAEAVSVAPPRLPEDSGVLQIDASTTLSLAGTLDTTPGTGGLGAQVDISSANIEVTGGSGASGQSGALVVTAASLDALGAQSLLLGGERSAYPEVAAATVVSAGSGYEVGDTIVLDGTGSLSGSPVLLVTGVDGNGGVTSVSVVTASAYELNNEPTGPIEQTSATLHGSAPGLGASFALSFQNLSVGAQSVQIDSGANLTAAQLLVAAQNSLTVQAGATIAPAGGGPPAAVEQLVGNGAFLDVSAGPEATVSRSLTTGSAGLLTLASGSMVSAAGGSIYLDASQGIAASGNLAISGGNLAVQASSMALGNAPASTAGTGVVLGQNILNAAGLRSLLLESASTIDVYGTVSASAQNVTLETAGISGYGGTGDVATLGASDTMTLTNPTASATNPQGQAPSALDEGTGAGSLVLNAANIALGGGTVTLSGFGSGVLLNAQNALAGSSTPSGVATAGSGAQSSSVTTEDALALATPGNLTVTASRVTTDAGIDLSLAASNGAVALLAPSHPASLGAVTALGGALTVSGSSIEIGTQIDMPSGQVVLSTNPPNGNSNGAGDIVLDSGASIDVAGIVQAFGDVQVASPGGTVQLDGAGNVNLAQGSAIDVSAAPGAAGGSLSISAVSGSVELDGALSGAGTSALSLQASSLQTSQNSSSFLDGLSTLLGTGFTGSVSVWLRGPGDLNLLSGSLDAQSVSLEADAGSIDIGNRGAISTTGVSGGSVTLSASNGITVNGAIDAQASSAGGTGGTVELDVENPGATLILSPQSINVAGGPAGDFGAGVGGTVLLRVPLETVQALTSGGNGIVLDNSILGASSTTLEAFETYQYQYGVLQQADLNPTTSLMYANASAFMTAANENQILGALHETQNASFVLLPGIEIDATPQSNGTGSLTLDSDWNLYDWRFDDPNGVQDVPGILTLRATNGVTIDASLTDGFALTPAQGGYGPGSGFTPLPQGANSWSYRIVAGADMTAANPLGVNPSPPMTSDSSPPDVSIGGTVRTGDGFIDVSAADDFVLQDASAALYTAGVTDTSAYQGLVEPTGRGVAKLGIGTAPLGYPIDGGNVSIDAGNDVIGVSPLPFEPSIANSIAGQMQLVNGWLWRVAQSPSAESPQSWVSWTVDFGAFSQGIGALGGGNVTVHAGGDVTDLQAAIPTVGELVGSSIASSTLNVAGGGALNVVAGGSILGGVYYVGQGTATLTAGTDVGAGDGGISAGGIAPVIAMGDTAVSVTGRRNASLADVLNPTLFNSGVDESRSEQPYFSTYGPDSSVSIVAVGGDVTIDGSSFTNLAAAAGDSLVHPGSGTGSAFQDAVSDTLGGAPVSLTIAPQTVSAEALSGSISVGQYLVLYPAPNGDLQLLAQSSVNFNAGAELTVAGADPALLPSVAAPQSTLGQFATIGSVLSGISSANPESANDPLVNASVPIHQGDDQAGIPPVLVIAATGDVNFAAVGNGTPPGIWSSKPVDVYAGGNIVDPELVAENMSSADTTSVTAGGSITYPIVYDSSGDIYPNLAGIKVLGPGELEVTAGGNVDLGTSNGIVTIGNLTGTSGDLLGGDPYLPSGGATISIEAGLSGGTVTVPQIASFIAQYVDGSAQFDSSLIAFVEGVTGSTQLTAAQAKAIFGSMSAALQRAFVEQLFFEVLDTYGSEAANGIGSIAGAYQAIQTLFPGANPDLSQGETDPYAGDISLYFSEVSTEQSGDISLLAPGGSIDVGLSLAPTAFGTQLQKTPSQLGLVAEGPGNVDTFSYGSLSVDQSRVFASNGGNIVIWSTEGNIDAGAGSKTAVAAPSPIVSYDANGNPTVSFTAQRSGSGIQAQSATPGVPPGNVSLFAPHGVINANDAGIAAGNLTVVAVQVLGTSNITVSGTEVGVPVTATGLGASVVGASTTAAGAMTSGEQSLAPTQQQQQQAPEAESALNWLDVFVLGFGEQNCSPNDEACLKREQKAH
ncbi:MAG TPA: filamentous hemagglutinin family protein [Steroidobacteraceae bacterium]|nr:filamentous hemagglutinin family protein [Steroidobacteraceae bacterium]